MYPAGLGGLCSSSLISYVSWGIYLTVEKKRSHIDAGVRLCETLSSWRAGGCVRHIEALRLCHWHPPRLCRHTRECVACDEIGHSGVRVSKYTRRWQRSCYLHETLSLVVKLNWHITHKLSPPHPVRRRRRTECYQVCLHSFVSPFSHDTECNQSTF